MRNILSLFRNRRLKPPKTYIIETTAMCNLACKMCNFHSKELRPGARREKGFMEVEMAGRLIDQIAGIGEEAWIAFHGAGEPLLHKGLIDILDHAAQYPMLKTGFLTNGMLLDRGKSASVIAAGISWIGFSIDGIDKIKFEKYRTGSDFNRILKNVLSFLEMKDQTGRRIMTKVNMTVQNEMTEDIERFIDFWIGKVDEVLISPCRKIGSRDNVLADKRAIRVPCYMLYEQMTIYWNGKVGLCCEDWFNAGNLGDVTKESIVDIWNGSKFNAARRCHEKGAYHKIPLCKECNSWYIDTRETRDERRDCTIRKSAWQHTYAKH